MLKIMSLKKLQLLDCLSEQDNLSAVKKTEMKTSKATFVTWTFCLPPQKQLSILLNFFFPFYTKINGLNVKSQEKVQSYSRQRRVCHIKRLTRLLARHWLKAGRKLLHIRISCNETYVRNAHAPPRAIPFAMIIKSNQHAAQYKYGAPEAEAEAPLCFVFPEMWVKFAIVWCKLA